MNRAHADILILAGGKARRLNGIDKGLIMLNKKPLIEHCIGRLNHNLYHNRANLIISANRNHKKYSNYAQHVVSDIIGDYEGPLAGIYTALKHIQSEYLLVIPCDMPFLPLDLYDQLKSTIHNNAACAVKHSDQIEPLLLLLKKTHIPGIANYLNDGRRSVIAWLQENHCVYAEYNNKAKHCINAWLNINTWQDINLAEKLITEQSNVEKRLPKPKNLLLTSAL